ncbi:MAG: hypothetical protein HUJ73_02355, partial [Eubacterium sp.]|nr:hypothetical protein [Eubacterium sp.]
MRKRKKDTRLAPWVIVVIIAAAIAVFFAVFYVPDENAEVVGSTRYKDSEIRKTAMPGFPEHNSVYLMLFRNKIVTEDLPFVESLEIEYLEHNRIRIQVNENYPVGYVLQDGKRLYFDANGVVTEALDDDEETMKESSGDAAGAKEGDSGRSRENTSEEKNSETGKSRGDSSEANNSGTGKSSENVPGKSDSGSGNSAENTSEMNKGADSASDTDFHPAVTNVCRVDGLTTEKLQLSQTIPVEDPSVFRTLQSLNKLITKLDILPDRIEIGKDQSVTLWYFGDKVAVALGRDDLLGEKTARAAAILPQLYGMEGILHLEHFSDDTINIVFEQTGKNKITDEKEDDPEETGESSETAAGYEDDTWYEDPNAYDAADPYSGYEDDTWYEDPNAYDAADPY